MISDEFEFIYKYFAELNPDFAPKAKAMGLELGIGDDAALVNMQGCYAITTDTLIEGVHFFPHCNGSILGARSLEVNFSDVYAMGAVPQFVTLSLNIPDRFLDFDEFWSAYAESFGQCLKNHNCALIGGNICRSPNKSSPLTITITAFGKSVRDGKSLRRDQAKIGELLVMTGCVGANGLYVKTTYNNAIRNLDLGTRQNLEARAFTYDARMGRFLEYLLDYSACAIDVSDGLLGDISHILQCSKVRALVNYENLPIDPLAKALAEDLRVSDKSLLKLAMNSGGDYNLVFTIKPQDLKELRERLKADPDLGTFTLTAIGEIIEPDADDYYEENSLITNGGLITIVDNDCEEVSLKLGTGAYNHFVKNKV